MKKFFGISMLIVCATNPAVAETKAECVAAAQARERTFEEDARNHPTGDATLDARVQAMLAAKRASAGDECVDPPAPNETKDQCMVRVDDNERIHQHQVAELRGVTERTRAARRKMDASIAAIRPSAASEAHLDALNTQAIIQETAEDVRENAKETLHVQQFMSDREACFRP